MGLRRALLAVWIAGLTVAGSAHAAEPVPAPIKKPRDAHGQPLTGSKTSPGTARPAATPAAKTTNVKTPSATTPNIKTPDKAQAGAKAQEQTAKPGTDGKAAPSPPSAGWPKTVDDAKAEAEAKLDPSKVLTEWSADEIAAATAQCKVILEKIDALTVPEPSMRQGECGAAAPVRLVSIGRDPEVAISPPAVLTCGMVGALHTWLTKDLQKLAKQHLGARIIKIESMSDYSCRNAYGRTKTKLSEHGRANALDIRGFVTERGELAYVLQGWGETNREIAARALAAQKAEEKAAAARAAASAASAEAAKAAKAAGQSVEVETGSTGPKVRSSIIEGTSGSPNPAPSLGIVPSQLGGPKEVLKDALKEPPAKMRRFLHAAHASACQIFGTTLGPEANNAHRNHFHVDMAPRTRSKICD